MRSLVIGCSILLLGGCSRLFGGGSSQDVAGTVDISVDSTLRVATTQLIHHGYTVQPAGQNSIVTTPRPVPAYLVQKADSLRNRQWILQVNANRQAFLRGTRLTVTGYVLPPGAPTTGTGKATVERAIPVTNRSPLFPEVRAVTGWITDEANRKK